MKNLFLVLVVFLSFGAHLPVQRESIIDPCVKVDMAKLADTAEEQELLRLVNELRQLSGLSALRVHATLSMTAKTHVRHLACKGYVGGDTIDGEKIIRFQDRLHKAGYPKNKKIGEIPTLGYANPAKIFKSISEDITTKPILLDPKFSFVGIGRVYVYDQVTHRENAFLVVDFGE